MKRLVFAIALLFTISFTLNAQTKKSYPEFEVEVTGSGPNLLLIPGATCSGAVWDETVKELSNQYTCHVFTLAGYAGAKPLEEAPILPQIEKALVNYILKEAPKPVVMGHSIGGFITLELVIQNKDLIQKAIVVDALPFLVAANNPAMTEEMAKQYPVEPMLKQYKEMSEEQFRNMQSQVVTSMLANEAYHDKVLDWSMKSDRATMAYTMNEMMTTDLRDDIAAIEIPVMVLGAWYPQSPYPKEQTEALYASQYEKLDKLQLKMADNARHFIMYDSPEWFMSQVKGFLSAKSL